MGYDIHVTRAPSWEDSLSHEISKVEWLSLVANDDELAPDPRNGDCAVSWRDEEGGTSGWFDWFGGQVFTTNPDRAVLGKALRIALFLDAHVEGDDGKIFYREEDWSDLPEGTLEKTP